MRSEAPGSIPQILILSVPVCRLTPTSSYSSFFISQMPVSGITVSPDYIVVGPFAACPG